MTGRPHDGPARPSRSPRRFVRPWRGAGRLSLHSLRHGYLSLLIAEGLDVVFVSRQLGQADPGVTLSVYTHLVRPGQARPRGSIGDRGELRGDGAVAFVARSSSRK